MKSSHQKSVLALAAAALLLGACATQAGPTVEPEWDSRSRAEIEDRIAASASRSANALETLAMIERARTEPVPSGISEGLQGFPDELRRPTTIEWSGPADEVAERLSKNIGYSFLKSGSEPSIPVMAQLSARDVPTIKAFENIGLQIAPYATLIVDPNVKRVELRYGSADAASE